MIGMCAFHLRQFFPCELGRIMNLGCMERCDDGRMGRGIDVFMIRSYDVEVEEFLVFVCFCFSFSEGV